MLKPWLLRFHRWIALAFGLPLLGIVATGLVLAIEPYIATAAIQPGSISPALVESLLQHHDPTGKARGLSVRAYESTLSLSGLRPGAPLTVDLTTLLEAPDSRTRRSSLFGTARQLHERLLLDGSWLVVASTIAMLAIIALGVGMGLPRLRNTLSGWHKGIAWSLLPLLVLSPLTGLLVALGITFSTPAASPRDRAAVMPLVEAVRLVGATRDLSAVSWIRAQGGRTLARINEGGELRVYLVSREGLVPVPSNWPRLIHEGTLSALWGGLINTVVSLALLGLLGSGAWLWVRRRWRQWASPKLSATPRPSRSPADLGSQTISLP